MNTLGRLKTRPHLHMANKTINAAVYFNKEVITSLAEISV